MDKELVTTAFNEAWSKLNFNDERFWAQFHDGFGESGKDISSINLRLDGEIAWPNGEYVEGNERQEVKKMLDTIFVDDLTDLIENGDVHFYGDALLKSFDGEAKRGKAAVEVRIMGMTITKELKPKKESTEFTVYFRPWVRYE